MKSAAGNAADGPAKRDDMVLAIVNSPYKEAVDGAALAGCISAVEFDRWLPRVADFFSDVPPDLICAFTEVQGISLTVLERAYQVVKAKTGECNRGLEDKLAMLTDRNCIKD